MFPLTMNMVSKKGGLAMYTSILAEKIVEFYKNPENMRKFKEWQKKYHEEQAKAAANTQLNAVTEGD